MTMSANDEFWSTVVKALGAKGKRDAIQPSWHLEVFPVYPSFKKQIDEKMIKWK